MEIPDIDFHFQVVTSLWAAAVVGSWCNFLTVMYIGKQVHSFVQACITIKFFLSVFSFTYGSLYFYLDYWSSNKFFRYTGYIVIQVYRHCYIDMQMILVV